MSKFILPAAALIAATSAFAVDVEIHGQAAADYAAYFDKDFDPTSVANQKVNLEATAYMDENFSVTVKAKSQSYLVNGEASEPRHGLARGTHIDSTDGRYTAFNFDGIEFRWEFSPNVAFLFGDLSYNAGSINYYYWRDTDLYANIKRTETIRGVGMEIGDGRIYFGGSENNASSLIMYGTYPFAIINRTNENLTITPSADWAFGTHTGRSYTYFFGTEISYTKSYDLMNYGIIASWGTHPYQGVGVHTFLLEPSFSYDFFNIGLTFYQALLADDSEPVEKQIFTDEQTLLAVEPSFTLHKKFAMGFAYEYHDVSNEIDDDEFQYFGPNFYFYPTANAEIIFWGGYNARETGANGFSFGMSGNVSF